MKRGIHASVVLAFVLALAAFAAGPAGAAGAPRKAATGTAVSGKSSKSHQLTGTVREVDAAAGTLTVQGRRRSVRLKAGEKVPLDRISAGDRVLVKYSGDIVSSVRKVPEKAAAPSPPARRE